MKLESVAEFLEDEGFGRRGTDIFAYHMPEEATTGILLLNPLSGTQIQHDLPGYRKGMFMVVVRAADYQTGFALCSEISALLNMAETDKLADVLVKYIRPQHDPVVYPNSTGDNLEFAVAFETAYVLI